MYSTTAFKNNQLFENYGVEYHVYEGIYTKPHSHNGFWEIFLITDGKLVHSFGGEKTVLQKNTLCLIRPQDEHCFLPYRSYTAKHFNLAIDDKTFKELLDSFNKELYPSLLNFDGVLQLNMTDEQVGNFFENMQQIFASPFTENDLVAITLKLKFVEFSYLIFTSYFRANVSYPQAVRDIIALMSDEKNAFESVDALCDRLPYARSYLLSSFKKYTGKTIIRYFTEMKLEKAYKLLVSTNYKIMYICSLVGFDSVSYFNKQFKLRYGVTPSSIRS
jgi:AraC-like DNA-binding protein